MNTLGTLFRWSVFGESHGKCVGVLLDGCPAGVRVGEEDLQKELDRRKPGQSSITTQRSESDRAEIMSGVFNGKTTGAPIVALVRNTDVQSDAYGEFAKIPRPGHSDYAAWLKYKGNNDYRGAGHFSGRLTAAYVMAGAVAKKALEAKGVGIAARVKKAGEAEDKKYYSVKEILASAEKNPVRCVDAGIAKKMVAEIEKAKSKGDSIGGIVQCVCEGVPAGLGEPRAGGVESELAKAIFAIPAVRGLVVGSPKERGSENNDAFVLKAGRIATKTNNAGGVLAGISIGMPLHFEVLFKPTPTIAKEQESVDLKSMKPAKVAGKGRHDPCILPRAVPVVEAQAACVLLDLALQAGVVSRAV